MNEINLLSSKIYNRIAAGEVVERPASIVKELIENSLDAGANKIIVTIQDGGITQIIVTDNGSGIDKTQLKKALMPHATSKISSLKDLDSISSLGFRGEALPSIASVSKLTIASKTNDQEIGASIFTEGGVNSEILESSCQNGTTVTVDNVFFNTPARAKFLKTPRAEEGEITSLISKFILGNPFVSFKYLSNGKTILQSFGDGLESAMVQVYGANVINDCFYIDTVKNGLKITGYIGKHYFSKPNRTYQTVFLNGRRIINQTIASAISNAYNSYLMTRQYPFYVLSLEIPFDIVDVNVHPNKLDVRFANNQIIYGSIYSVISKVLDGSGEALNIVSPTRQPLETKTDNHYNFIEKINNDYVTHKKDIASNSFVFSDSAIENKLLSNYKEKEEKEKSIADIFAENKAYIEKLEKEKIEQKQFIVSQEKIKIDKKLNLIGQALNTFIILDDGENLYFIDQHAAHERILYDKLNLAISSNDIPQQPLLVPYVFNVNPSEMEFLLNNVNNIREIGIEIEQFGNDLFKISSIPTVLSHLNLKLFIDNLLSNVNGYKSISLNDILKEKVAKIACKSAIKSGDKLTDSEIDFLLKLLQNDLGLKCPHGRPVAIKITRMEIDKWFKRIV